MVESLSNFPSPGSLVLTQLSTSSDANPEGSSNVGNKTVNAQDHHFPRDVDDTACSLVTIILCICASLWQHSVILCGFVTRVFLDDPSTTVPFCALVWRQKFVCHNVINSYLFYCPQETHASQCHWVPSALTEHRDCTRSVLAIVLLGTDELRAWFLKVRSRTNT